MEKPNPSQADSLQEHLLSSTKMFVLAKLEALGASVQSYRPAGTHCRLEQVSNRLQDCVQILEAGSNVAVVVASKAPVLLDAGSANVYLGTGAAAKSPAIAQMSDDSAVLVSHKRPHEHGHGNNHVQAMVTQNKGEFKRLKLDWTKEESNLEHHSLTRRARNAEGLRTELVLQNPLHGQPVHLANERFTAGHTPSVSLAYRDGHQQACQQQISKCGSDYGSRSVNRLENSSDLANHPRLDLKPQGEHKDQYRGVKSLPCETEALQMPCDEHTTDSAKRHTAPSSRNFFDYHRLLRRGTIPINRELTTLETIGKLDRLVVYKEGRIEYECVEGNWYHKSLFRAKCYYRGEHSLDLLLGSGEGMTKTVAKQLAAKRALGNRVIEDLVAMKANARALMRSGASHSERVVTFQPAPQATPQPASTIAVPTSGEIPCYVSGIIDGINVERSAMPCLMGAECSNRLTCFFNHDIEPGEILDPFTSADEFLSHLPGPAIPQYHVTGANTVPVSGVIKQEVEPLIIDEDQSRPAHSKSLSQSSTVMFRGRGNACFSAF